MAQDWAKPFYNSKSWIELSHYIRIKNLYKCELCGRYGNVVHHKIILTPQNINDPEISLNEDNLMLLCHDCHDKIHERFGYMQQDRNIFFDENGNIKTVVDKTNKTDIF